MPKHNSGSTRKREAPQDPVLRRSHGALPVHMPNAGVKNPGKFMPVHSKQYSKIHLPVTWQDRKAHKTPLF